MKKLILGLLTLILVVGIVVAGCAKPAPTTTTPTTTPTTTAPAPASAKPVELALAIHTPPGHFINNGFEQWIAKVQEGTKGRVKIILYPSESLGKQLDQWDLLLSRVCDITFVIPGNYAAFPLYNSLELMYAKPKKPDMNYVDTIFNKYMYKEFEKSKVLFFIPRAGTSMINTVKKAVNTMEDVKGLQIRTPPGLQTGFIKVLGGTPVVVPAPELYTALERGTVAGCLFPPEAVKSFKIYEVVKYHTYLSPGASWWTAVMNLDAWNSLTPDVQKVFNDVRPWAQQLFLDLNVADDDAAEQLFKKVGNTVIRLDPAEEVRWVEAYKPTIMEEAAKLDAKGLPGTAMVGDMLKYREAQK